MARGLPDSSFRTPLLSKLAQSPFVSKLAPSLSEPSGPFQVGFCDIEYQSPTPIEAAIQNHGNIFLRLLYPTSTLPASSPLKRPLWSCHPRYLRGYLEFVGIPESLGLPVIYLLFGRARLPCVEFAEPVSDKTVPELASLEFPVLLFSHGLGGMRTTYSQVCYEFASYGFVVASLEHLDGSACVSFTHGGQKKISYIRNLGARFGREGRQIQLNYRVGELIKCIELLTALQKGDERIRIYDPDQLRFNSLRHHRPDSPFRILIRQLKGRLDLTSVYFCGHSFGATTAIEGAYQLSRDPFQIKAVLAFDPWMALAGDHLFLDPLSKPTLVVNTHLFQDEISISKLHRLFRIETSDTHDFAEKESKMLTILNAGHQAQSDIATLLPSRLRNLPFVRDMVGSLSPEVTLKLTTQACREYLNPYLPPPWREQISSNSVSIFHPNPKERPKDITLGASLYGNG